MDFLVRRRNLGAFSILGSMIALLVIFGACDDHGIEADFFKGTVRGELQINTVVPDTTDEIRVALATEFPPSSLQQLITSGVIQVDKDPAVTSQVVPFEMQAPYGEYGATIVIWKAKDQSFQLTDIVGIFGNLERFELRSISLSEEHPVKDSVNIPVDLSRVDRRSSIEGQIEFVGEWPENTSVVALVVAKNLLELTRGIPPAIAFIPKEVEQFDYKVGVAADTYEFIAVAWLPVGEFDLSKLRILGFYQDPPGRQGKVVVEDNMTVTGIDITADFAEIGS
ncbi:hypothetical protein GWO43_24015 [candidate division KSB1 bacterium]|nr:hypothetical protein [candidate division KSB1 bacterium]NIR73337.1 hypothetical protein [candidate division KSB1 bacterium]NIS27043.1 hypothetical protein [candidate division KSB1 bacterium]NIT73883.1 hypothetical protein [candidate division KSB1 bacterium]NIU27788.1 hypothetical protein [candidate division KSB1 bacterium]